MRLLLLDKGHVMTIKLQLNVLLSMTLWGVGAVAAPLPVAQAVTEARAQGFDVRVAQAAVRAAQADLVSARALPNPTASIAAGPSVGCFSPENGCRAGSPSITAQLSEQGVLSQLLTGKTALRERVAASGLDAAKMNQLDAQRQLVSLVKQEFVSTIVSELTRDFATQVRDSTRRSVDLIRERYRAGAVDEADLSRVETQSLEAEQALDSTLQTVSQQQSVMRFLLGRVNGGPGALELDASPFFPPRPVPLLDGASLDTLVSKALETRPDVKAQMAQVAQTEAAVRSLRRQRIPDIAIFAGYSQQGLAPDYSSPPNVTVGLSIPIPIAYRLAGEIAHAEANVATERIQLERIHAQVRSDVETAWSAYRITLSQVRRMNDGLLRSAARARDLVSIQYEKGAASLIEFLDAQRTFVSINVEYLSVVQAYWTAVFRLEAALGQELAS